MNKQKRPTPWRTGENCNFYVHGCTHTRLYKIWRGMKERCFRKNHPHFNNYGGRGITVCDEWLDFNKFKAWSDESGYRDDLTIDRIDSNGIYEPKNCRWTTDKEQNRNKRNNRMLEYGGERKPLIYFSEKYGIGKTTLKERLNQGWSVKKAIETPIENHKKTYFAFGKSLTLSEWSKESGISVKTIRQRLVYGWCIEEAITAKPREVRHEHKNESEEEDANL